MYLIQTLKEGPVAACYKARVAEAAVTALRCLYPGQKVWYGPASCARVNETGVEMLNSLQETEIVTAWRVSLRREGPDVKEFVYPNRRTLRGLVRVTIWGQPDDLMAEAHSEAAARSLAQHGLTDLPLRFAVGDLPGV
ncbi:hypothetical protein ACI3L1_09095 [Deinococcus sp. SM5_A1]|uniref:hypothetical protein n=1 Tax=Deinococcus sp. SM5_A1 TaxID=3379094 RepID=UPI003859127E